MLQTEDIVAYARGLADALRKDMCWNRNEGYNGYWTSINESQIFELSARAFSALELLRQYAGSDSFWTLRAATLYDNHGHNKSIESGIYAIGDLLTAWVEQVEAGVVDLLGAQARDEVAVVSTDLMGQVRQLLERKDTHPSASIVLCGAALESALRSVVEAKEVSLTDGERPGLATLTTALRKAELISKQDVKELQQLAGLRNAAAHGQFDDLSRERAGLMEQQVNIWLRRIADLLGAAQRIQIDETGD